jgi:hypothetical protein
MKYNVFLYGFVALSTKLAKKKRHIGNSAEFPR